MLNGEMEMPNKTAWRPFTLAGPEVPMTKESAIFVAKTKLIRAGNLSRMVLNSLNSLTNMASGLVSKGGS